MNVEKRAIRQRLREQRRALSAGAMESVGRAVHERLREFPLYTGAASVIAYIAHENEVPTDGLLEEAARRGQRIYLPTEGVPIGVVRWRAGEPLAVGRGGVSAPSGGVPTAPESPAVVFVPVVGWDICGGRLGRGGGFYDRLFATLTSGITRIGLAYEFQECPEVPRDPWDISLDYVITERRILQCGGVVSLQKGELQLS